KLYIADYGNNAVRAVDLSSGVIQTIAGTGTQGYNGDNIPATMASLNHPLGVAVDNVDDLFIADAGNNRIRMVDLSTGIISTVAGNGTHGFSGDGGLAMDASLSSPGAIAVGSNGDLYIADTSNSRIR